MSEVLTQVEINATPQRVWQVLMDFASYPEWNSEFWPEGAEVKPGAKLRVHLNPRGRLKVSFRTTVTQADRERILCWVGRLPAGLLEGRHSFSIVPLGPNRVRFVQREVYTGLLVFAYIRVTKGWLRRMYDKMNQELRARAEITPNG